MMRDLKAARVPFKWTLRDLLILMFLTLFAIQVVRADFFVNDAWGKDWQKYANGTERMPYQGRVTMMPYLHWAEHNSFMRRGAAKVQIMMDAGTDHPNHHEPESVEKFASMLAGLVAVLLLLAYTVWYGLTREFRLWWLPSTMMLAILAISMSIKSERNVWTAYDLPHACLFGIAVLCAFESAWLPMLFLFALDVPTRETALYLIAVAVLMAYSSWRGGRHAVLRTAALSFTMGVYWLAWYLAIKHRFANNASDIGPEMSFNLHEILFPNHWPQLACAGGYIILFVWLERHRLNPRQKLLLYGTLICCPITLYFGVWGETRIWVEWTLPWAILATIEIEHFLFQAARGLETQGLPQS
jgi:hypothetical protein